MYSFHWKSENVLILTNILTNVSFKSTWQLKSLKLRTEHSNSDFDHFVARGTLCVDDVSATVGEFAEGDGAHRHHVGRLDLRGNTTDWFQLSLMSFSQTLISFTSVQVTVTDILMLIFDSNNTRMWGWSDLWVNGQCMKVILLLYLSGSIKGPGNFGDRSSSNGGRNLDGGSCSAVEEVMSAHIQSDCWFNWTTNAQSLIQTQISEKKHLYHHNKQMYQN